MNRIKQPNNLFADIKNINTGEIKKEKITEISLKFIYIGQKTFEKLTNRGINFLRDRRKIYNELIIDKIYEG